MKYAYNKISVIGLGYIGLPTAAILATRGIDVVGVDVNEKAVAIINQGNVHIEEPDLDILVRAAVTSGKLKALASPESADAFIIAVPTPFKDEHVPDLSYIEAAAKAIAPVLQKGNLIILESTSPVGSTEQLSTWLGNYRSDLKFPHESGAEADIHIAHCPERVLPGKVLTELIENDRVIGGITPTCAERAKDLYKSFVSGECIITDARTAEMAKLVENAFRDVNIAFANELSIICEKLDINVWELIELANRHPRVNILQPGPGVGGHCIAVDPWFIVNAANDEARLIRTAREVNDSKPAYVIDKILNASSGIKTPVIACLGLAFKANIDDLRESPALQIVIQLAKDSGYRILAVEPHIHELPDSLKKIANIELVDQDYALETANVAVLLVDHNAFREIKPTQLTDKKIIDTRGFWK